MMFAFCVFASLAIFTTSATGAREPDYGRAPSIGRNTVDMEDDCEHGNDGYIIELDPKAASTEAGKASVLRLLLKLRGRGQVIHELKLINSVAVRGLDIRTVNMLQSDREIKKVTRNCIVRLDDPPGSDVKEPATQALSWGLDRIDDRLEMDGTYLDGNRNGSGAVVYILDTGVRTAHTDFKNRARAGWSSGCASPGDVGCTSDGGETGWVHEGVIKSDTSKCNGHGTHCASTAGGFDYGVAKATTIVTVQVLSCEGYGSDASIMGGIEFAVDDFKQNGKPAVMSMSLGGMGRNAYDEIIESAMDEGVLTIVAAGNSARNACRYSPASTLAAVTVGSTEEDNSLSYYSNFGRCVDILAPGGLITAAWSSSNTATNTISGTSMAAPHVAGVAAQILSEHPSMSPEALTTTLTCMATPAREVIDGVTWFKWPPFLEIGLLFNDHDESDAKSCLPGP